MPNAPPENIAEAERAAVAWGYEFVVVHASTAPFPNDLRTAESVKDANRDCVIGFLRARSNRHDLTWRSPTGGSAPQACGATVLVAFARNLHCAHSLT
jgi:hypothetical protein